MADIQHLFTDISGKKPMSIEEIKEEIDSIEVLAAKDKRPIAQANFKKRTEKLQSQIKILEEQLRKKYATRYSKFTKVFYQD